MLLLIFSATIVRADYSDALRAALSKADDKERLSIYGKLYDMSLETDDVDYQLRCVNDMIAEAHRQDIKKEEGDALVQKMTLFFNTEMNDSIYEQVPPVLDFLRGIKEWKNYYETWSLLVNTYNFTGQTNTGLKEVQEMYDDAKKREDLYGMGLAYYGMGNVYANMYNHDEAASSYEKSINLLMQIKPTPMQLSDIFAYYCDVLEILKDYRRINDITQQWQKFLTEHYAKKTKDGEALNRWAYYYLARAQAAIGLNEFDAASEMLDEMKKRCPSEESFLNMMWLYYRAELCKKQGFYVEALALNNRRMQFMMDSDDKSILIRVRKQRAEILEGLGRYEEAAKMYNEMYLINDSINTHDTKRQLTEMNTLFHVDELKMQQAQAQARYTIIISAIIVVALIIFIYFRMRSAKRLKIAHEKLEDAHGRLEETHEKLETAHQELLTAYDQLEETTAAKERIESDLRIARNIQMGMVPHNFPDRPDLDIYASMTPAKEVGGDLYGYLLKGDALYFCVGDVSGKGVPASLFMAQVTRLFRTLANQQMAPADICTQMNEALSGDENPTCMFVTLFMGLLDLQTGHLQFCNAGHNPPVIGGGDQHGEFLKMLPNFPIGVLPGLEFQGEEIDSIKGRPLFVYTDGLNEAENREHEQFGDDQLLSILRNTHFESAQQVVETLYNEVQRHRDGADPNDDLTMMCLRMQ